MATDHESAPALGSDGAGARHPALASPGGHRAIARASGPGIAGAPDRRAGGLLSEPADGVVKFRCDWTEAPPSRSPHLPALIAVRDHLHQRGWIGVDASGIGYGNISVRLDAERFLVSATQTGAVARTGPEHYVEVVACEISANALSCRGPARASSESLTHAAIYHADRAAGAVVHVHHRLAWERSLGRIPTTRREVPYGTPEMAEEMARLLGGTQAEGRVLAMAGHQDGLIAWGGDLAGAVAVLERLWKTLELDL